MRIGVLGSRDVGRTLARGFAARGHEVKLGTRDPESEKIRTWLAESPGATAGTFAEAAGFGELLVLASLWDGTENAMRLAARVRPRRGRSA